MEAAGYEEPDLSLYPEMRRSIAACHLVLGTSSTQWAAAAAAAGGAGGAGGGASLLASSEAFLFLLPSIGAKGARPEKSVVCFIIGQI